MRQAGDIPNAPGEFRPLMVSAGGRYWFAMKNIAEPVTVMLYLSKTLINPWNNSGDAG